MNNKLLIGLVTAGAITATAATAYAFGPNNNDEIKTALDNSDYSAWSEAVSQTPRGEEMLSVINETNFDQLVEAHNLMESGDKEGAKEIMESLGLDEFFGKGPDGQMGDPEQFQAVKDALDNNDYQAWVDAISGTPKGDKMLEVINESNFDKLVEIHNLRNQIQEISTELGLPEMKGPGFGGNRGEGPMDTGNSSGQGQNGQGNTNSQQS